MRFFAEETISLSAISPTGFTASVYDNSNASRATRALATVVGFPVALSFINVPTLTSSHTYGAGSTFEIDGFDNISQAQMLSIGGSGSLFVSYGN